MQIQASFGGTDLRALADLGLDVYRLIPTFRSICPACGAADCAVRHGLYYRRVVDVDGRRIDRLPVPRFRCRASAFGSRTFSVLPSGVLPRRLLSRGLRLRIVELIAGGLTREDVLDLLASGDVRGNGALSLDEKHLQRVLADRAGPLYEEFT